MRRRPTAALAVALACGILLAGCAPRPLGDDAALSLQASVRQVAENAAANDPTAAIGELDALQARLDGAVADGEVGTERARAIQAAVDTVRVDLVQSIADAEAAAAAEAERVAEAERRAAADRVEAERAAADKAHADREAEKAAERAAREAEKLENDKKRDEEED